MHSHIPGISPIRNSDDPNHDRCFPIAEECFLSRDARGARDERGENGEPRREAHTHRFKFRRRMRRRRRHSLFIEWSVKLKKGNVGLINDILNTRRGRWRKFSGLLQCAAAPPAARFHAARAVSEGISQSRVHRRANKFADENREIRWFNFIN